MSIVRILVVGDNHISSSNRSNHIDYPGEGVEALEFIVNTVAERGITHYIGLGDITYGKFDLTYRAKIDSLYAKRNELTNGNVVELRGNHDMSLKGISEWEYYNTHRKLINTAVGLVSVSDGYKYLDLNGVRLHFVDYGAEKCELQILEGATNFAFAHNYFKFKESNMANYGKAIDLDYYEQWFGVDAIFCGHIHQNKMLKGSMFKGGSSKEVLVYYPGNLIRTDFLKDMPQAGEALIITVEDGNATFEKIAIPWRSEEDAFQVGDIIKERKKVDISDIVKSLNDKERHIGNPESIIQNMSDYDIKYREKAIELLREGLN